MRAQNEDPSLGSRRSGLRRRFRSSLYGPRIPIAGRRVFRRRIREPATDRGRHRERVHRHPRGSDAARDLRRPAARLPAAAALRLERRGVATGGDRDRAQDPRGRERIARFRGRAPAALAASVNIASICPEEGEPPSAAQAEGRAGPPRERRSARGKRCAAFGAEPDQSSKSCAGSPASGRVTDVPRGWSARSEHGEPLQAHDPPHHRVRPRSSGARCAPAPRGRSPGCGATKRARTAMLKFALHEGGTRTSGRSACWRARRACGGRLAWGRGNLREAARYYGCAHAAARAGAPPASCAWTGINAASPRHARLRRRRARVTSPPRCATSAKSALDRVAPGDRAVCTGCWRRWRGGWRWCVATSTKRKSGGGAPARPLPETDSPTLATTWRLATPARASQRHDPARLDACLTLPRVVTFAGPHDRSAGASDAAVSRPRWRRRCATRSSPSCVASMRASDTAAPACGGDILFLETMLARAAEVHVVLPYVASEFRRAQRGPSRRVGRALRRHAAAGRVRRDGDRVQRSPGAAATYDYANMLLEGLCGDPRPGNSTRRSFCSRCGTGVPVTDWVGRRRSCAAGRRSAARCASSTSPALLNAAGSIVVKSAAPSSARDARGRQRQARRGDAVRCGRRRLQPADRGRSAALRQRVPRHDR